MAPFSPSRLQNPRLKAHRPSMLVLNKCYATRISNKFKTGTLRSLPMVADPGDILKGAMNKAKKQTPGSRITNGAEREKSRAMKQIQMLHSGLIGPLKRYMEGFPRLSRVHEFEHAMIILTIGDERYQSVLREVGELRKRMNEICKTYANRIKNSRKKQEVLDVMAEAFETVERVFTKHQSAIEKLKYNAIQLRKLPQVDLTEATIALVGAPNVGKSSLVRLLSSGEPEVNAYPFTTREIKMGHFYAEGRRHQLTDTPGLLLRAPDMRNNMENLTMATLSYLPTAVLFVFDLTGRCGTNVSEQLEIREELLLDFPGKKWIDVFTKADLIFNEDGSLQEEYIDKDAPVAIDRVPDALRVSSYTEVGLDVLKESMIQKTVRYRSELENEDQEGS
eukprot:CAMPEP_0167768540 /NCGR_PEP_ID=MMETSP0110_2-20121227/16729_1 /TAXON_ID=629695 /ORGANISM="Gymnochlora sp., Strain CCMP2014" /LENGTH=391 /DNA_ID=CAMNT_0007657235 /DNA_START=27 /DNA_END=1202 /DNA_ORIENTATION=-